MVYLFLFQQLIKNRKPPLYFPTFGTVIFKHGSTRTPIKFIKIFHNSKNTNFLWEIYINEYKDFINNLIEDKIISLPKDTYF